MIDLKVGMRTRRKPVLRENAIVAGSRPMPILPRAAIAANVPRIGRADSAGGEGEVGQGAGSALAFDPVREPDSGSNLTQGAGNRLGRQVFNARDPKRRPFRNRGDMRDSRKEAAGEKEA